MNLSPLRLGRVASIDVFRALTMLCMIFVNDLWSLLHVPKWMGHADFNEDFLGFSDIVFPAFLFAVGLSIPFAIENRISKGDATWKIIWHILLRSFALIVMGMFSVNTEAGISSSIGMSRTTYKILMITGFFLVWNVYPKTVDWKKYLFIALKVIGVALLVYLAVIFRDNSGGILQKRWWGILGQIGWTYLPCAFIYMVARKRLYIHLSVLLVFTLLNMAGSNNWLGIFHGYIVSNGAHQVLTMTGIIVSLVFILYSATIHIKKLLMFLTGYGVLFLLAGFAARQIWIISKLTATPTWIFFCAGISVLLYIFLYWLVDMKGKERWFSIIKPAGTATLTCYLLPTIVYSLFQIWNIKFPELIRLYPLGLLKSLAIAMAVIGLTALLGKIHIKLKI